MRLLDRWQKPADYFRIRKNQHVKRWCVVHSCAVLEPISLKRSYLLARMHREQETKYQNARSATDSGMPDAIVYADAEGVIGAEPRRPSDP
jgi:hypothetical protein